MPIVISSSGGSVEFEFPPLKTGSVSATFWGPNIKHVEISRSDYASVDNIYGCPPDPEAVSYPLIPHLGPGSVMVKVTPLYSNEPCIGASGLGTIAFNSPQEIDEGLPESKWLFANADKEQVLIVIAIEEEYGQGRPRLKELAKFSIMGLMAGLLAYIGIMVAGLIEDEDDPIH